MLLKNQTQGGGQKGNFKRFTKKPEGLVPGETNSTLTKKRIYNRNLPRYGGGETCKKNPTVGLNPAKGPPIAQKKGTIERGNLQIFPQKNRVSNKSVKVANTIKRVERTKGSFSTLKKGRQTRSFRKHTQKKENGDQNGPVVLGNGVPPDGDVVQRHRARTPKTPFGSKYRGGRGD